MRLSERSVISRPASAVWPFIVVPSEFKKWNDKIVEMDAGDRFYERQVFSTLYEMSGKRSRMRTTVTALEEGRLLELRHDQGVDIAADTVVVERITVSGDGGRCVVDKDVVVRNHHMPWWLMPLIWFVTRFGRRAGPDKLQQLCEGLEK